MIQLTEIQQGTLDYIAGHIEEHGYAPSIREIAAACGGVKPNAVADRLVALERKGYISRTNGKARAIRIEAHTAKAPDTRHQWLVKDTVDRLASLIYEHKRPGDNDYAEALRVINLLGEDGKDVFTAVWNFAMLHEPEVG